MSEVIHDQTDQDSRPEDPIVDEIMSLYMEQQPVGGGHQGEGLAGGGRGQSIAAAACQRIQAETATCGAARDAACVRARLAVSDYEWVAGVDGNAAGTNEIIISSAPANARP